MVETVCVLHPSDVTTECDPECMCPGGGQKYLELQSVESCSGTGRIVTTLQAISDLQAAQSGDCAKWLFGHIKCATPKHNFYNQLFQVA